MKITRKNTAITGFWLAGILYTGLYIIILTAWSLSINGSIMHRNKNIIKKNVPLVDFQFRTQFGRKLQSLQGMIHIV